MGHYDAQQVCLNGHQITDSYHYSTTFRKKFCDTCGEKTIYQCSNCNKDIPGYYIADGFVGIGMPTEVPTHCGECGKAFPWHQDKQDLVNQFTGPEEINSMRLIEQICSRFHLVAKQIRNRYSDRETLEINDEYDVQDLLHSLLHIYYEDIRAEEWCPSYAGGGSRVDFLLKEEQIVIEVKKTRKGLKAKQIGEQLIIDSVRYRAHPDCKKLYCFVYDPDGWVSNPKGIENDLNKSIEDFEIKVLIVPKGH